MARGQCPADAVFGQKSDGSVFETDPQGAIKTVLHMIEANRRHQFVSMLSFEYLEIIYSVDVGFLLHGGGILLKPLLEETQGHPEPPLG